MNFLSLLRATLDRGFIESRGEPIKLGNVTFEVDIYGYSHDIPAEDWDMPKIVEDIKSINERKVLA